MKYYLDNESVENPCYGMNNGSKALEDRGEDRAMVNERKSEQ